jgi:hypothetical protein
MQIFDVLSPDGGPIFLASLPNERGNGKVPHHQYVKNEAELQRFIAERDRPGWAIYHTPAILRNGAWRSQENVRATLLAWGEVDFKDHPDIPPEEIVRRLSKIPTHVKPTFCVFSGHGIHLYWVLKEEVDASPGEGQRQVEDVLKLICNYIGGDPHVAETARLMRLPGSHNTRKPGENILVTLQDVEMGRRYDLVDLTDFFLEAHPIMPTPTVAASGQQDAFKYGDADVDNMEVGEALKAMRFKGRPDIHNTQLRATASMISAGRSVAEAVNDILAATTEAVRNDERAKNWNWEDEKSDITRMCHDWITKRMKEDGEDLSAALPDDMYLKWQDILKKGERPVIKYNGAGPYVRGYSWAGEAQDEGSPGEQGPQSNSDDRGGDRPPKRKRIRLIPYDAPDRTKIPRRDWLYGYHYMRRIVSATVGPGGIGKSSLGLVEAIGMAIGRDLLGTEQLKQPLRVWYHNGEDPREEINRRIAAICIYFNLHEQEVKKNMFITCGLDMPIKVARGATEVKLDKGLITEIISTIQEHELDVEIFDPLVTLHNTSELLTATMDPVIREVFAAIANETTTAVELAHHTRKKANGQDEYTVADARGSSGIVDAVRMMRVTNPMSKEEADGFGIDDLERENYFRVTKGKTNMTRRGVSRWYRFNSVTLPNGDPDRDIPGDEVGVLEAWQRPSLEVPITDADRRWIVELVKANSMLQEDYRAKNWIGKPLGAHLGLDPDNKVDRFRLQNVVKKLIGEGALRTVEHRDEKGRKRNHLVANTTESGTA